MELYLFWLVVIVLNIYSIPFSATKQILPALGPGFVQNISDNVHSSKNDAKIDTEEQQLPLSKTGETQKILRISEVQTDHGVSRGRVEVTCTSAKSYNCTVREDDSNKVAFNQSMDFVSFRSKNASKFGKGDQCKKLRPDTDHFGEEIDENEYKQVSIRDEKDDGTYNNFTESASSLTGYNLKKTMKLQNKTVVDIVDSSYELEDLDEKLTFTCQGRCGERRSFPCSCSEVCVLYKTCCENISYDCPDTVQRGREMFSSYTSSKFTCDEKQPTGVYKVSSCPIAELTTQKTNDKGRTLDTFGADDERYASVSKSSNAVDDKDNDDEENHTYENLSVEDIERRILSAPVTDKVNGVTYLNMSIRNCYIGSDKVTNHLSWGVSFFYSNQSPDGLHNLKQPYPPIPYTPLFSTDILLQHICSPALIDSCNGSVNPPATRSGDFKRCREFAGAVATSARGIIYRNRYCAYCNEGRHNHLYLVMVDRLPTYKTTSSLRVLVSLTEDGNFHLQLEESLMFARAIKTWSSAECPSQEKNLTNNDQYHLSQVPEENGSECQVTCNDDRFTLHSDGRCKAKHAALVAFGDDDLPSLCEAALSRLAHFVSCGVKLLLQDSALLHVEFLKPTVSTATDARTNKTLHIIKLNMYIPNYFHKIFSHTSSNDVKNVAAVAVVLKAVIYRMSLDAITCDDGTQVVTFGPGGTYAVESDHLDKFIKSKNRFYSNVTHAMATVRGPVADTENTTTLCVSKSDLEPATDLNLMCMDDADYERDAQGIDQLVSSECGIDMQQIHDGAPNLQRNNASAKHLLLLQIWFVTMTLFLRQNNLV